MISIPKEKRKKNYSPESLLVTAMTLIFQRLYLASSSAFNFKLPSLLNMFILQSFF